MIQRHSLVFAATLAITVACATPADLLPAAGPGTHYPCGTHGVVCAIQHTCCSEGDTCGGEPESVGCPPGQCCFIGPSDGLGAERPRPQRPQK